MRHRLTDIVRDTVVYGNLDDMYEGLKLMHEALLTRLGPLVTGPPMQTVDLPPKLKVRNLILGPISFIRNCSCNFRFESEQDGDLEIVEFNDRHGNRVLLFQNPSSDYETCAVVMCVHRGGRKKLINLRKTCSARDE